VKWLMIFEGRPATRENDSTVKVETGTDFTFLTTTLKSQTMETTKIETLELIKAEVIENQELAPIRHYDLQIAEWAKELKAITISGIDDKENIKKVNELRLNSKRARIAVEKKRKEAKKRWIDLIDGEAERITKLLDPIETDAEALLEPINKEIQRQADEKKEKDAKILADRIARLVAIGMIFDGTNYILKSDDGDIGFTIDQIQEESEEDFENTFIIAQTEFDYQANKKAEAEAAAETARLDALYEAEQARIKLEDEQTRLAKEKEDFEAEKAALAKEKADLEAEKLKMQEPPRIVFTDPKSANEVKFNPIRKEELDHLKDIQVTDKENPIEFTVDFGLINGPDNSGDEIKEFVPEEDQIQQIDLKPNYMVGTGFKISPELQDVLSGEVTQNVPHEEVVFLPLVKSFKHPSFEPDQFKEIEESPLPKMELTSLTKENFWNDLYEKHPIIMKKFCDWIDEYKVRVDWSSYFKHFDNCGGFEEFKFHDLPIGLQIGVIIQFTMESRIMPLQLDCKDIYEIVNAIRFWFETAIPDYSEA
jgi:hypothetical protein